ncbi:MAG: hypothetical protein QXJ59_06450 [Thermofilaceae archaeon]
MGPEERGVGMDAEEEEVEEVVGEIVLRDFLKRLERALDEGSETDTSFLTPLIWEAAPPILFPEGEVRYTLDPPLELPPILCQLVSGHFNRMRASGVRVKGGALSLELRLDDGTVKVFSPKDGQGGMRDLAVIFSLWLLMRRRGVDFLEDLLREGEANLERLARLREAAERVRALALLLG